MVFQLWSVRRSELWSIFQMWRREIEAMEKLDILEGNLVLEASKVDSKDSKSGEEGAVFDINVVEAKVHGTLRRNAKAWEEAGAGNFVMSVIKDGFKLNLNQMPEEYEEKNNKSFLKEEVFAVEAIEKLVKMKILKEVERDEVSCVNPLTVAINDRGKKRLCIDLSHYVNEFTTATKFRIESTIQFLQVVKEGDYLYAFDLKGAYHQIKMFKEHWRFLGLSVKIKGVKKFFVFTCLPFGLNDVARALTKLLRFPLQRWREWGVRAFIHLDDGLGAVKGRKEAQVMADGVKKDLAEFGLITSEDKCTWEVTQELEWTGWLINTKKFVIYVTERKVLKAEQKLEQLLGKVGKKVRVKELSLLVGLIISFGLAVGRSARFYTRSSTMEVARVAEEKGWEAGLVLPLEVVLELRYWKENLRRLNGQKIRKKAGMQVVRPKLLYSDAGGNMAGGCMIVDKRVCKDTVFQVSLTEEEVGRSSTYRELRGIEEGMKALAGKIVGKGVRWHWSACKIVEYSSMKKDCHRVAKKINDLIHEFNVGGAQALTPSVRTGARGSATFIHLWAWCPGCWRRRGRTGRGACCSCPTGQAVWLRRRSD